MKKLSFIVALLLVATATFAQEEVKKSFSGIKRIRISTSSGDCELRKSSGSSVEVLLSHNLDSKSFSPRIEQTGDRLELGEEYRGNNYDGRIKWVLSVPDNINVSFKTGSGNLVVNDVKIDLSAGTGSGDLGLYSVKGNIDVTTGSGNVEMKNFNGEARMNTGSGDMDVTDSQGDIDLNCGSGDIKLNSVKALFAVNTGSGNITADKITVDGNSKFNTGSGRARVTLAATPTANLSVNTGSGDAELNFNGNEIVGQVVMRASKRNGNISAPFDFDTTEEIDNGGRDNVTIVKTAQRGKGTNRINVSTGSGDAVLKK